MRYFFNTQDGRRFPDEEGLELQDLRSACIEATKALGKFMEQRPEDFWTHDCLLLEVTDDKGLVLFTLQLSVVLSAAIGGRHPPISA